MKNKPAPPKKPADGFMKLFCLVDTKTNRTVVDAQGNTLYFNDKKVAKAKRQDGQHIAVGPDHRRHPDYQMEEA